MYNGVVLFLSFFLVGCSVLEVTLHRTKSAISLKMVEKFSRVAGSVRLQIWNQNRSNRTKNY